MGLFTKKKTQTELVAERLQAMKDDKQQTLSDFYHLEMGKEEEIQRKIENPPPGIWKKNRYKERKKAELEELKEQHDFLFDREGMVAAQDMSTNVIQELNRRKGIKDQGNIEDVEEVFQTLDLYAADGLVQTEMLLPETEAYKFYKGALESCKRDERPKLDAKTKKTVRTSLYILLEDNGESNDAMEFLARKHPKIQKLLYYRALLESMENELGIMIRQEGADLRGLKRSEYAKFYGQRLAVDALVARLILKQDSMQQEYRQYLQEEKNQKESNSPVEEDEDFVILNGREEKEEEKVEEKKVEQKEEKKEKPESPDQMLYKQMSKLDLEHTYIPYGCKRAEYFLGIYKNLKTYLETRIQKKNKNMDKEWLQIRQAMAKDGLRKNMGAISDISSFSLTLIRKEEFGMDFLKNTDESLFLEYAVQAVAEAFAQAMKDTAEQTGMIDKEDAKRVKTQIEQFKQELNSDEKNKDRIEKAKVAFRSARQEGIEETWQKYPECFSYYEFMNDEVVKTNQYLEGKRKEKGLFETYDFNVFDSNKPEVLKAYLTYYREHYLDKEGHDPMYDEIYVYLEKHINYRVEAQERLKKLGEQGSVEAYKKGKTFEVNEKKGKYVLKGFETTKQNTGQGCWSVAMAAMLQYRGYQVNQTDIRSHRFEADTKINYNSSYHQNMNCALDIANHANLLAELAPDAMMKQIFFGILPSKNELKKRIQNMAKEAIGKSHGPIAVLFKGHYRVIYGCKGEDVIMHDPLKENVETVSLNKLIDQMQGAPNLSFYWLADLPEVNAEGERVLEVEDKAIDIRYDKDGVLEYKGTDEYEDPGLSIVRNNYAQFCTGGNMYSRLEYVYLPASKKQKLG